MKRTTLYAIPLIASALSANAGEAVYSALAVNYLTPSPATKVINNEIMAAVWANNRSWMYAYNSDDVDALSGLYTEDSAVLPPEGVVVESKDLKEYWTAQIDNKYEDLVIEPISVQVNDDEVYVAAAWKAKIDGVPVSGQSEKVLVRQENGFLKTKIQTWK